MKRLLLVSNSTVHGRGYLDHCAEELRDFLGPGVRRVTFVPYALFDHAAYAARARSRFSELGFELESLHESLDPRAAVLRAEALFVGGGNTFRLLARLYDFDLVTAIQERVAADMPYVGSSAGTGVACTTIKTTNDMPIVEVPTLAALALVPFNVNAHYLDPDPSSTHMGETREQRIAQFHEENAATVVGLREGAWLRVEGDALTLDGANGARVFRRGRAPEELETPSRHDELLRGA